MQRSAPKNKALPVWREHPRLRGKFHPLHPDRLQVLVHAGASRLSGWGSEKVWATVLSGSGSVFMARLESDARDLPDHLSGATIQFFVEPGTGVPVQVENETLEELPFFEIGACPNCGFRGILSPPSALAVQALETVEDENSLEFQVACPFDNGAQKVRIRPGKKLPENLQSKMFTSARKWWKFWK